MAIAARVPQFKKGQARHTVKKWVYFFGAGKAEGDGTWRDLLGGKGAGLAEMTKIGLAVPAGFTISTEACDYYYKNGKKYPPELKKQVADNVAKLERITKKKPSNVKNPELKLYLRSCIRSPWTKGNSPFLTKLLVALPMT